MIRGALTPAQMAGALAAALPALVFMHQRLTGLVGLVWLGFCLWHLPRLRPDPAARTMLRSPLAAGFITSVVLLAVLIALHGGRWSSLHNPSRFVLVLPMAIVVAALRPSCRPFFAATAFAGIVAGAVAVWEVLVTGAVGPLDAHLGFTNRNKFAWVAATALLVTAAGFRLPDIARPPRGLLALGAFGALVALVLANTRGAWIATLVPVWIWLLAARTLSGRRRTAMAAASVVLAGGLALVPGSPVHDRIELGLAQWSGYAQGQVVAGDSVGERLEMWRASAAMFAAHPWIGIGPGRFNAALNTMIAAGEVSPAVAPQGHPHNEYLAAAATGGVVGLVALLAVLAGPLVHFGVLARRPGPRDTVARACALAGLLVTGMTALFCATDAFFYIHFSTVYYALTLALLAGFAAAGEGPPAP